MTAHPDIPEARRLALRLAGEALFGEEWRRPMARALGPLHPHGARESIDPRLPARWAIADRDIPDWVGPALATLLQERVDAMEGLPARIRGAWAA